MVPAGVKVVRDSNLSQLLSLIASPPLSLSSLVIYSQDTVPKSPNHSLSSVSDWNTSFKDNKKLLTF